MTDRVATCELWSSGDETIGTVLFSYEDGGYITRAAAMATVIAKAPTMLAMTRLRARVPPDLIPWAQDGGPARLARIRPRSGASCTPSSRWRRGAAMQLNAIEATRRHQAGRTGIAMSDGSEIPEVEIGFREQLRAWPDAHRERSAGAWMVLWKSVSKLASHFASLGCGPRRGRKVFTLQVLPPVAEEFRALDAAIRPATAPDGQGQKLR